MDTNDRKEKFDLLIIFRDGSRSLVRDVTDYGLMSKNENQTIWRYVKNNHYTFMPFDAISLIGRADEFLNRIDPKQED